jgi:hypothetical protein
MRSARRRQVPDALGVRDNAGAQIGEVGTSGYEQGIVSGDGLLHFEIRLFSGVFHPDWPSWDLLPSRSAPAPTFVRC